MERFELSTSSLPRKPPELHWRSLSGRRGSNPRPLAWKANALPTELLPHSFRFFPAITSSDFVPSVLTTARLLRRSSLVFLVLTGNKLQKSSVIPAITSSDSPELVGEGRRWIRTTEGINQQIYSLPHLATLVFSRFFVSFVRLLRWTSHRRSVIYSSKLLPSSFVRL